MMVNIYIYIDIIEIDGLPINSMVIFYSYVSHHQRVNQL